MHSILCSLVIIVLNKACAGRTRAWFLEIAFVQEVCMRVCLCVCPLGYENYSREMNPE